MGVEIKMFRVENFEQKISPHAQGMRGEVYEAPKSTPQEVIIPHLSWNNPPVKFKLKMTGICIA